LLQKYAKFKISYPACERLENAHSLQLKVLAVCNHGINWNNLLWKCYLFEKHITEKLQTSINFCLQLHASKAQGIICEYSTQAKIGEIKILDQEEAYLNPIIAETKIPGL